MITLQYSKNYQGRTWARSVCETCGFACSAPVDHRQGFVVTRMLAHLVMEHGFVVPELQRDEDTVATTPQVLDCKPAEPGRE